jgi:hypothetical protein
MEELRSRSSATKDVRGSKAAMTEGDKEEHKKKRRSWVNLLVR